MRSRRSPRRVTPRTQREYMSRCHVYCLLFRWTSCLMIDSEFSRDTRKRSLIPRSRSRSRSSSLTLLEPGVGYRPFASQDLQVGYLVGDVLRHVTTSGAVVHITGPVPAVRAFEPLQ